MVTLPCLYSAHSCAKPDSCPLEVKPHPIKPSTVLAKRKQDFLGISASRNDLVHKLEQGVVIYMSHVEVLASGIKI